jgi:prepilin-type N-terminal cleavage/methylation domain-containing protein
MKNLKTKIICSKGFTLVEVIVTIMAAGILGAIFIQFMGTALNSSWNAVEIVRDESNGEALMEQIIAEYVALINNNNPELALSTIDNYDGQTINGISITARYIIFNTSGDEVILSPYDTSDNLKIMLRASGPVSPAITGRFPLTIILTNSRREIGDQKVIY